ncbi:DUF421 domain-containing protein [Dyadobacter subterraneus]|uniref:DUF421 domain-containing protein n=1 Tax=Dyadobacter subterraneus TaxID=2773304 RepID=A0ABR9WFE9_9BACT|nr:YetF domain-containing protein [Dyadobacter subterraneus]MBE9464234.1 DUF421 domain-containing protein [Dyadobacter subterraneus]
MKPEDIHFGDWHRILFGDVPGSFFVEVIFRTAIIYAILMISMRLMGKRMEASLGRNEMISMISLAAAIGIPLQSPDRGLLPAVIIACVVVFTQQFIAKKATQNEKFEAITQDNVGVLVEDGKLNLDVMKKTRITRERVFGQLRYKEISQLGEVKRLYLEANGTFTFIESTKPVCGLSILPSWDTEFKKRVSKETNDMVCNHCGNIPKEFLKEEACDRCGFTDWVKAVESISKD